MKAQAAVEYLIMVGVILAIAIPIFYYSLTYSSESVAISKSKEAAEAIASGVDYVYSLGEGTRTTVAIDIPTNVKESYILDNEIGFRISTSAGITDVYAMSMTNVTGSLPDTPGRHFIVIKHLGDGVVIE